MTTLTNSESALSLGFWLANLIIVLVGTTITLNLLSATRRVPVLARRTHRLQARYDNRL